MTIQDLQESETRAESQSILSGDYESSQISETSGDGKEGLKANGDGKGFHIADKLKNGVGTSLLVLGGVGAGMLLMYMFDPQQGRRRRALARDKAKSASNKTKKVIGKKSRDLRNRAQDVLIEAKKTLMPENNRELSGEENLQESSESMNQAQSPQM